MSTDIRPGWAVNHDLRVELADARAKQQQAEDAQHDAERTARRAEERATTAEDDRDGWRMLARDLLTPMLLDHEPDLTQDAIDRITDLAHDLHGQGHEITDRTLYDLVNDWTEER